MNRKVILICVGLLVCLVGLYISGAYEQSRLQSLPRFEPSMMDRFMSSASMPQRDDPRLTKKLSSWATELIVAYDASLQLSSRGLDRIEGEHEGHSHRVAEMTVRLAIALGSSKDELGFMRLGAYLHDLGNLVVPETILKKKGKLTSHEWFTIHMHPTYAYEMIDPFDSLKLVIDIPYCHHERWDGDGYPRGLKGTEIPHSARIFAVVDVYDALTSDRPYRKAWTKDRALNHIREQAGTHFDPDAVKVFIDEKLTSRMNRA